MRGALGPSPSEARSWPCAAAIPQAGSVPRSSPEARAVQEGIKLPLL